MKEKQIYNPYLPSYEYVPDGEPHVFGERVYLYGIHAMWAPDVVKGPDGRYYLYYCLDYLPEIAVAVCNTPAGKYEYLGMVRYEDGTLGRWLWRRALRRN